MYIHTTTRSSETIGQASGCASCDFQMADEFIQAYYATNKSRWCSPGDENHETCKGMTAPRQIKRIVIHTLAVPSTSQRSGAEAVVEGWKKAPSARETGAHYIVDRDGTITQMVHEADIAFHARPYNQESIGIEHADLCNTPEPYKRKLYERSAELVRDILSRHRLPARVYRIDTNSTSAATVIGHSGLTAGHHGDPGPYWDWEYYRQLLKWDGVTRATRPLRMVGVVKKDSPVPLGWESRTRVQVLGETRTKLPNDECANRNHSYSDEYWLAKPNTPGVNIKFSFAPKREGLYKVSLWWPNVSGANPETYLQVNVQKAGGPAMGNFVVNQKRGYGRWNDLGSPFIFTVPGSGARVDVRVRRNSPKPGWILVDAARILKIG